MATWITGGVVAEPIVIAHSEEESQEGAQVLLRCPWANRHDVVENIFANALVWPYWPETGWIPLTFTIKGTPTVRTSAVASEEMIAYLTADIALTFGDPKGGQGDPGIGQPGGGSDAEIVYYETYQPSGEMLRLPPRLKDKWQFRWGAIRTNSLDVAQDEGPTRLIVGLDYVIRWVGLEEVPEAFFDAPDHVNSNSILTSAGKTFAPGTLLCQSPVIQRTVTTAASPALWEVEARFSYRKDGWNKFWSPVYGEFRSMYKYVPPNAPVGTLYENFPSYNFSGMLP